METREKKYQDKIRHFVFQIKNDIGNLGYWMNEYIKYVKYPQSQLLFEEEINQDILDIKTLLSNLYIMDKHCPEQEFEIVDKKYLESLKLEIENLKFEKDILDNQNLELKNKLTSESTLEEDYRDCVQRISKIGDLLEVHFCVESKEYIKYPELVEDIWDKLCPLFDQDNWSDFCI